MVRRHTSSLFPILAVLLSAFPCAADGQVAAQDPTTGQTPPTVRERPTTLAGRSTVYAPNGIAAPSQPLATAAALGILQGGGNAIDAAVAAAAVLIVVEPHMTGMGGDVFAILWSAEEGRLVGLDASGRSGSLAYPDTLLALGMTRVPSSGALSVTVPGAVSGWSALLDKYGTLSLAEALQPAIDIAENGFPGSPIIASQWRGNTRKLQRDPGAAATYLLAGEEGPRTPDAGEWFQNPDWLERLP